MEQDNILKSDSTEAQKIIDQLSIEKLPVLVFRSEDPLKNSFKVAVEKGARVVDDTTIVWEQTQPPYVDTNSQKVSGLVNIIFIKDNTCSGCYDVKAMQKGILSNFGVFFASEKTVDVSDEAGQKLIEQYAITSVPTIILSKEAADYPWLQQPWRQVGTIEPDGSYVFREMDVLKVKYKDLITNQIKG